MKLLFQKNLVGSWGKDPMMVELWRSLIPRNTSNE